MFDPSGARIEITSRRGAALIAMLATDRDGERDREWLSDTLWGSRGDKHARGSLRKVLSELKGQLNRSGEELIRVTAHRIDLNLERVRVDIEDPAACRGDFLEGFDIREEGFEDWLRAERSALEARRQRANTASTPRPVGEPSPAAARVFGRPFLAVLPFANLTGESDLGYQAEGLAEDLIDRLSRLRWVPVISRAASFGPLPTGLFAIGQALGARYIIEGRLRRQGEQFEVGAWISDAESGQELWSWRGGLPAGWGAADLDVLFTEVVAALAGRIDDAEMVRAVARPAADLRVSDMIWRARWLHNRYTREDGAEAERLLLRALEMEPNSPEAIVQLADFRQRQVWLSRGGRQEIMALRALAQRAITADYLDGRGYLIAGIAELWLRRTEAAITLFDQAIALNPSLAYAYSQIGAAYYLSNRPEQAIAPLERALRLNMGQQHAYYVYGELAMAWAMLDRHEACLEAADNAIARRPGYWLAHVVKVHALVARGQMAQARAALARLLAVKPRFVASEHLNWVPFINDEWPVRLMASLRSAGLVERREDFTADA